MSCAKAMIVNVNPYDTGMEENSHVMKFASVARQVVTLKSSPPTPVAKSKPTPALPEAVPEQEPALIKEEHAQQSQPPDSIADITVEGKKPPAYRPACHCY